MPISDNFDPAYDITFDAALVSTETDYGRSKLESGLKTIVPQQREKERLSLELDFARISHQSTTDTAHPHVLFSPVHYESGYAYPLLVWLHGGGSDERQVMKVMPAISMRNYVAVAPQGVSVVQSEDRNDKNAKGLSSTGLSASWHCLDVNSILRDGARQKVFYDWPDTDEAFGNAEHRVFDCISLAKQRNNIASNRIFLAGFGTGGTMALRLAMLYPESFAGVASLGGALPQGNSILRRWNAARSLSIFLGAGETSSVFSPSSACGALQLLHTAGVRVAVREYACGQELAPAMLQDLNRWMMNIVCG